MLLVDISTDTYIHIMKMLARVLRIQQNHVGLYRSDIYVYVGYFFKVRHKFTRVKYQLCTGIEVRSGDVFAQKIWHKPTQHHYLSFSRSCRWTYMLMTFWAAAAPTFQHIIRITHAPSRMGISTYNCISLAVWAQNRCTWTIYDQNPRVPHHRSV